MGPGVIDQVGEGVDPSRLGQRVLVYYYAGCGECEWCRRGEENLCGSLKAEYGFFGDVAVVYGAGTVGYGLIQVARLRGARVIAVGRTPEKLALARELGAHEVVSATHRSEDVAGRVRDLTGGRGGPQ